MVSVYTPHELPLNNKSLLPVLVWIHGNEFHKGSGNADMQGPNRIMDYGVVRILKYIKYLKNKSQYFHR